ncbi:Nucleolar GTP-binding protein 1, partial [Aduncisulcus paluster]
MTKVKATQSFATEKLQYILSEFPQIDDIHPFYKGLLNVLYDRDYYKLALSQIAKAKGIVDNQAKRYVSLLRHADSAFKCKSLKRAALGIMCSVIRKQNPALVFLEQCRQHMSRLPAIEPSARTLVLAGCPSAGKSSFMKSVSKADVDIQEYSFTTKSLFCGHMDYRHLRWQIIDTPGLLDHELEDRNGIEMQSIMALVHLRAAILYIIDPTESCGMDIDQQVGLFRQLAVTFKNKPLIVLLNKADMWSWDKLPEHTRDVLLSLDAAKTLEIAVTEWQGYIEGKSDPSKRSPEEFNKTLPSVMSDNPLNNIRFVITSTLNSAGIALVKRISCELLLQVRAEQSRKSVSQGVFIAQPQFRPGAGHKVKRDVPETVAVEIREREAIQREKEAGDILRERELGVLSSREGVHTLKDEQQELGVGKFDFDWREHHELENPEWVHDAVPEEYQGHNVADWIDPEIEKKLAALEEEEDRMIAEFKAKWDGGKAYASLKEWEKKYKRVKKAPEFTSTKVPAKAIKRRLRADTEYTALDTVAGEDVDVRKTLKQSSKIRQLRKRQTGRMLETGVKTASELKRIEKRDKRENRSRLREGQQGVTDKIIV